MVATNRGKTVSIWRKGYLLPFIFFFMSSLAMSNETVCTYSELNYWAIYHTSIQVINGKAFLETQGEDNRFARAYLPFKLFNKRPVPIVVYRSIFEPPAKQYLLEHEPLLLMNLRQKEQQGYKLVEGKDIYPSAKGFHRWKCGNTYGIMKIVYLVYPVLNFHKHPEICTIYLGYYDQQYTMYLRSSDPHVLECSRDPGANLITMRLLK